MGLSDDEIVAPDLVPDDLVCAVCLDTFLDPVHCPDSPCRHIYCRQCIVDTLQRHKEECPTCRRPIVAAQLVPNGVVRERLNEIVVFCPNRNSGCNWTGQLATREEHERCCLAEDLRQCRDELAQCRQEVVEGNMQIIQRDEEIRDLNERLRASRDTMNAIQRSNETKLLEANAQRTKQDDLIQHLRTRSALQQSQIKELEDVNAKLGARNLDLEVELAHKMSALDLTSKGVQCTMKDVLCADAEGVVESSRDFQESCPTDDVLEAVKQCDLAHLRAILRTGAPEEVNVTTTGEGMTALHLAAHAGHTAAVQILLGNKKFAAVSSHASKKGALHTALHSAAAAGHQGVVTLLLENLRFTAASARTLQGSTALHLAAHYGRAGVVDLLLKSHCFEDADVNAVNRHGRTALHSAVHGGNTGIVMLLLTCARFHKASISDMPYNATALHAAAHWGHAAIAIALLKSPKFHTAAVNASHATGETALHVAAKQGYRQVALALRDSSRFTAVTARCLEGKTAMDIARQRGDEEMISLLLSWPGAPFA